MKPGAPAPANTPVAGDAASSQPGQGGAPDDGGDWLAEITERPTPQPTEGAPLPSRRRGDTHRGRANESKRGHHNG